jgi:hypothetical protein
VPLNTIKTDLVATIREQLQRARTLYDRIARNGMHLVGVNPRALRQTDKRDAAQFIFFEAAAQFEDFMFEAFKIESRHRLGISAVRVPYIIGSSDRGFTGIMGWAAPTVVRDRAENLYGRVGFFARLNTVLGAATYQRLGYAHLVRNRIAHQGGDARKKYRNILGTLGVPVGSRKGLGPGRLLLEYPAASPPNDKWFYRFLTCYDDVVTSFNATVVIP